MFVKERIIDTMADQREARGLTPERESPQVLAAKAKAQKKGRGVKAEPKVEESLDPVERREINFFLRWCVAYPTDAVQKVLENANKVTKEQIVTFLEICRTRYLRAKIEPGKSHSNGVGSC